MIVRGIEDRFLIDRLILASFLAMFPTGFASITLSWIWYPLIYLFWLGWPLLTWVILTKKEITFRRCSECMSRTKRGAVRCRKCGQPLEPVGCPPVS